MKVTLFLTYGNSLGTWDRAGILERELAIYKEQARRYQIDLTIFSYGKKSEREYQERFPEIKICFNHLSLPTMIYGKLAPLLFPRMLQEANVIKTNQMLGAHVAASCSRKYGKPLYVRQGYSFFESERGKWGEQSKQARAARIYETQMACLADWLTLPSEHLVTEFVSRNPESQEKISVLPNYFAETTWVPRFRSLPRDGLLKIGYLGKFTEQKNLVTLIEACKGLSVELNLIGSGPLESQLKKASERTKVDVRFHGRLDQSQAREVLRRCHCFILPSNYEGQPKALIEAMAFGMPVIGTNIRGIVEVIEDNETGFVVERGRASIRSGIKRISKVSARELERLGQNARSYAVMRHGLKRVAEQDFGVISKLLRSGSPSLESES